MAKSLLDHVPQCARPRPAASLGFEAEGRVGVCGVDAGDDLGVGSRSLLPIDEEHRADRHVLDTSDGHELTIERPTGRFRGVHILNDLGPVLVTLVADQWHIHGHHRCLIHGVRVEGRRDMKHGRRSSLYALHMPKLRLFANLREIAGQSSVEIHAGTVGGVIEEATRRYGPQFSEGVRASRVWVNGISASQDLAVGPEDEVVLIPPVSGGSQPVAAVTVTDFLVFAPVLVALAAVVGNLANQAVWSAVVVGIASVWALDVGAAFASRGRVFAPLAVGVSAAGAVMASHVLGGSGYGVSLALAVLVTFAWAIVIPEYRDIGAYVPTFITAAVAAMAGSSMGLAWSAHSPSEAAVDVFLLAVIVAVALGSIVARAPSVPFLDPFSVAALAAIAAAVIGAMVWDLDVVSYLLIGLGIAVALVAGRGFGSMLRIGDVRLTERGPGVLPSLDGVLLAAAIYYPLLVVVF